MNIKNNKGITLISLGITIIILIILLNIIVYNVMDNLQLADVEELQTDISNLRDKTLNFYAEYGTIPINKKYEYTNISMLENIKGANDIGKFYILDLSAIENLTLNYGKDFESYKQILADVNIDDVNKAIEINKLTDIYIINEASHNIFYVEGIELDDSLLYTDYVASEKDTQKVEERIVENVVIPKGYSYDETSIDEIIIKDIDGNKYKWIEIKNEITEIPDNITNINNEDDRKAFLENVNKYNGYYIDIKSEENVIYVN